MTPINAALETIMAGLVGLRDQRRAEAPAEPITPWPEPEDIRDEHFTWGAGDCAEPWSSARLPIMTARPYRSCPACGDSGWKCPCQYVIARAEAIGRARIHASRVGATLGNFKYKILDSDLPLENAQAFSRIFRPLGAGMNGRQQLRTLAAHGKAEGLPRNQWDWGALLIGPPGTGKSHLGAAFARSACVRGYSARWNYWPDLLRAYRAIQSPKCEVSEFDFIAAITSSDVVVLDEVRFDLGGKNDYKVTLLATLLDEIQGRGGKLVVTSNFRAEELRQHASDHVVSRMLALAPVVECRARDARTGEVAGW